MIDQWCFYDKLALAKNSVYQCDDIVRLRMATRGPVERTGFGEHLPFDQETRSNCTLASSY